jgi:hypothetical protein
MANVPSLDDEDHVLCDVRGVVADPFKMARYEDEIDARFNDVRIAQHIGDGLLFRLNTTSPSAGCNSQWQEDRRP